MEEPIVTERLRMRPFTHDDAEAGFAALWSDPEIGRWIGGAHGDLAQTRELIDAHLRNQERHGFSQWAVEEREGGALVGEVGLQPLEHLGPEIEIGWVIARRAWGRGYATEAARAWLDVAFGPLGLDAVLATVLPQNAASHRVAQRLGMRLAPTRRHVHGAEHDIYWAYQ